MRLLAAVFGLAAARLPTLTAEIYSSHLAKRHIFVVACPAADQVCAKHQDDFEDEWKRFDKQNKEEFSSALFGLARGADNAAFFDALTAAATTPVIVYAEEGQGEQKQFLDPATTSLRGLREWLRDIEAIYADRKINQRIEELDVMINGLQNPSYLAQLVQSHQSDSSAGAEAPAKETAQNVPAEAAAPADRAAVGRGPVAPQAGAEEALRLQSKIDDLESLNGKERNINIHQVNVQELSAKEKELVSGYLQQQASRAAPAAAAATPAKLPKVSAEDIDITKLSPQEADVIVKYINERRKSEESRRQKQEEALAATSAYLKNPPPPRVAAPVAAPLLLVDAPRVINLTNRTPAPRWSPAGVLKALSFRSLARELAMPPLYPGLWVLASILAALAAARYLLRFRQNVYRRLKANSSAFEEI